MGLQVKLDLGMRSQECDDSDDGSIVEDIRWVLFCSEGLVLKQLILKSIIQTLIQI